MQAAPPPPPPPLPPPSAPASPQNGPGILVTIFQCLLGISNCLLSVLMFQPMYSSTYFLGILSMTSAAEKEHAAANVGASAGLGAASAGLEEANKQLAAAGVGISISYKSGYLTDILSGPSLHELRAAVAFTIILGIVEVATVCVSTVAWQLNKKFIHFAVCGLRGFQFLLIIITYAICIDIFRGFYTLTVMSNPSSVLSDKMDPHAKRALAAGMSLPFHIIFVCVSLASSVLLALKGSKPSNSAPAAAAPAAAPAGAAVAAAPVAAAPVAAAPVAAAPVGAPVPVAPGAPVAPAV